MFWPVRTNEGGMASVHVSFKKGARPLCMSDKMICSSHEKGGVSGHVICLKGGVTSYAVNPWEGGVASDARQCH